MGFGHSQRGSEKDTFELREGGLVLSEDYSRFLEPGEHGGRLGSPAPAGSRWATSTIPTPPARHFPWLTASAW